jgi:redox-sensing transcriptional repressor
MFKNINVIMRISKYKKVLTKFKSLGFEKVFSDNLADAIGVTSTQVRKDFSIFGISGNRRGGYNIDNLIETINTLLNKNEPQKIIIVGVGNMGSAFMNYKRFDEDSIKIMAGFDSDPKKVNRFAIIPILPIEEIKDFFETNPGIKICILTVPDTAAQGIFEKLVDCGIKAVLNFTQVNLRGPDDIYINNVDIIQEIDTLIYYVNKAENNDIKK